MICISLFFVLGLLHSVRHSSSIHVAANDIILFFLMVSNIPLHWWVISQSWVYISHHLYSSVYGHLGYFHVWLLKTVLQWILGCICPSDHVFSGVGLQGHSVQFSCSVVSDSLQPHEPQHTRTPRPSPAPRVYSNSCPLNQWCHPTILFSVVPFSFCPQSFLASGSFQMSKLFTWGGQSIGVSASASVLPVNTQDWSPLGWTGWISLQSKGLSRVFYNTTVQKYQFFSSQLSL